MSVQLRQLHVAELVAILAADGSFVADGPIHPGALPPALVARRALTRIEAGEPTPWWAPFLILERPDRAVVGGCAFKGPPRHGRVEVLYGVAPDRRGRGIASTALEALTATAFAWSATEVMAEIEPHNLASARVVARCGFTLAGERLAEDGVRVAQWLRGGR